MNPPTADDLAAYLQLGAPDALCEQSVEAAVQFVEDRRFRTDPVVLWVRPDVNLGCLQYAALLYQTKAAPTGLPEYDELAASYGSSMAGIYRLVGGPDPAVA